jgi:hypothetical protein
MAHLAPPASPGIPSDVPNVNVPETNTDIIARVAGPSGQ